MAAPRPPITDSPWFWAYLFSMAALIGLALIGPKYGSRQAQIERQFQGRQHAAAHSASQLEGVIEPPASEAFSAAGRTLVSLRPLWLGLAAVTTVAWIVFWRNYVARPGAATSSSQETSP